LMRVITRQSIETIRKVCQKGTIIKVKPTRVDLMVENKDGTPKIMTVALIEKCKFPQVVGTVEAQFNSQQIKEAFQMINSKIRKEL